MARRGENIRKRKDGRWEGRYSIKVPNGKNKSKSIYAATYSEAKKKLAEAKQKAIKESSENSRKKEITQGSNLIIAQMAEEWLAHVLETKKYSTYIKYRSIYRKYIHGKIGTLMITELNNQRVDEILFSADDKNISANTKNTVYSVLGQIIKYTIEKYHLQTIAFEKPSFKRKKKEIEIFNSSEQIKLLQFLCDDTDVFKMGILLCLHTGLRLGELCALRWSDIDFKGKVLHVNRTVQRIAVDGMESKTVLYECEPKSDCSKREIPLPDAIAKQLTTYLKPCTYVFYKEKPMEPRTYQKKLEAYLKDCDIQKKNFHALRHTFATNCISNGMDVKCLSEIMGHSDVQITLNRYVHPSLETKRQHLNALEAIYGQHMGLAG